MDSDTKGQAPDEGGETTPRKGAAGKRRRGPKPADTHVASALKTAYHATVEEDVPSEFLDLLGKLA